MHHCVNPTIVLIVLDLATRIDNLSRPAMSQFSHAGRNPRPDPGNPTLPHPGNHSQSIDLRGLND
jgi:hypothetical protein